MDNKLFTALEIAVIGGLILAVMYFGGVFHSEAGPKPTLIATVPLRDPSTPTPALVNPTRTPHPSSTPKSTSTLHLTRTPLATPVPPLLTGPAGMITFESNRDGNFEIYTIHANGSYERNLTNDPADDRWPTWSPDGNRIAFFSNRNGWPEIYMMEADGAHLVQVTHTLSKNIVYESPVFWSSDGKEILAVRRTVWSSYQLPDTLALELIRFDGSGSTTVFEIAGLYLRPSWSPDGKHIYIYLLAQEQQRQTFSLFIGTLTGAQFDFKLANPELLGDTYVWSPDSSRLAFEDNDHNIVTVLPDGSARRQLVSTSHTSLFLEIISWSPDGQYLLYTTDGFVFHTVRADGSSGIDLDAQVKARDYDSAMNIDWSPDSQWLTYQKQGEIFIVNIYRSASPSQLTRSGNNYSPQWQPIPNGQ